jgi:hypothetical protein
MPPEVPGIAILRPCQSTGLECDGFGLLIERWDSIYFGTVKILFNTAKGDEALNK